MRAKSGSLSHAEDQPQQTSPITNIGGKPNTRESNFKQPYEMSFKLLRGKCIKGISKNSTLQIKANEWAKEKLSVW